MMKMVKKWFLIENLKYTIPIILVVFYFFLSTFKWMHYKKKYTAIKQKIEYIVEPTILIDSLQYETFKEIIKKSDDIVIHDTLVTDDRILYLLQKYK